MNTKFDIMTELPHVSPAGMEHQKRRKNGTGNWYAT